MWNIFLLAQQFFVQHSIFFVLPNVNIKNIVNKEK